MRAPPGALLLAGLLALSGCASLDTRGGAPAAGLRLGDLLLVGFRGTRVEGNAELRALVCDLRVGGLILFERDVATGRPRNIVSPAQVRTLTAELQALAMACAGRPLFIAADNEGGAVMRLSPRLGYLPAPSAQELGEAGDVALTELEARRMGATLRETGINWNLAPVVDVAINPANPAVVALGRSFSPDPERVTAHARAFIRGMHAAGVLTTLKHFPGHGSSRRDSHAGFTDVSDTADLRAELAPYRTLIAEGLADSVMTAHVFNRNLDPWDPATLSRFTVNGLLRRRLGWTGVVVSDDLLMGAILERYGLEEAAVLALEAGVDMLLVSANAPKDEAGAALRMLHAIERALGQGRLSRARIESSLARIDALRARIPR
jgi:beta-N-acetylhexosaminidase